VVAHQLENVLVGTSWMKISTLKRKPPGRRNRPQRKTRLEPVNRIINPIGHSMNAYSSIKSTEVILKPRFKKTKNTDRDQAMHYRRLYGYFDETNGLMRSGIYMAQFLRMGLAHERVA
jgi:hypothetical protein